MDRLQTIDNNTKGIVWRGYNYLRSFVTKDNGIDEDTSVALKIIKCRNR